MSNSIVGVKYIGAKESKSDNVAGTNAVWKSGEVLNFSSDIAKQLIAYTGVFEIADPDPNASTYIGKVKQDKTADVVPFVNINAMDANALAIYARLNFNQTIDIAAPIQDLRNQVQNFMVQDNLDQLDAEQKASKKQTQSISLDVDEAEYQAYLHGIVELKLVPVSEQLTANEPDISAQIKSEIEVESETHVEAIKSENVDDLELAELVAKMDKKSLLAFARQNKLKFSNTFTEDKLRTLILEGVKA